MLIKLVNKPLTLHLVRSAASARLYYILEFSRSPNPARMTYGHCRATLNQFPGISICLTPYLTSLLRNAHRGFESELEQGRRAASGSTESANLRLDFSFTMALAALQIASNMATSKSSQVDLVNGRARVMT